MPTTVPAATRPNATSSCVDSLPAAPVACTDAPPVGATPEGTGRDVGLNGGAAAMGADGAANGDLGAGLAA
jgi:hypothetical protein